MKRSGDSTHLCQSPTPKVVNGCDLNPLTWTGTSEQEYRVLTASKRWPSTPQAATLPKALCVDLVHMLLEVDNIYVGLFGMLPVFLENLLENINLISSVVARTKTTPGILKLWFNYFRTSLIQSLGIHFSKEVMGRELPR